jgi:hypothetical protein
MSFQSLVYLVNYKNKKNTKTFLEHTTVKLRLQDHSLLNSRVQVHGLIPETTSIFIDFLNSYKTILEMDFLQEESISFYKKIFYKTFFKFKHA